MAILIGFMDQELFAFTSYNEFRQENATGFEKTTGSPARLPVVIKYTDYCLMAWALQVSTSMEIWYVPA